MDIQTLKSEIFHIKSFDAFNDLALRVFQYQYQNNDVYRRFVDLLPVKTENINSCYDIPCMPVEFYKNYEICCLKEEPVLCFRSSGTGSGLRSTNFIFSTALYEKSILESFSMFFGPPGDYIILALVPDYLQAKESSLAYMLDFLIKKSVRTNGGFYMNDYDGLLKVLQENGGSKKIVFGITYALMDFATHAGKMPENTIVIETGGMKGRRKEVTRAELYDFLKERFGVPVFSEYSMCELMSQAYSDETGGYRTPPWMKIYVRELNDPFSRVTGHKSGGINIIDLANLYTCSFLSTQDIGVLQNNDTFEVLGRFDFSDTRGCSLLV